MARAGSGGPIVARDRRVLEFAQALEELQVGFYDAALRSGHLTGEVRQFAQIVGSEERKHLGYVRKALGADHAPRSRFQFGDALADDRRFVATATHLEQVGLAAYNGQAGNVSAPTLRALSRVISVEARHVAWIRGIAGEIPAPDPTDAPIGAAAALRALDRYL